MKKTTLPDQIMDTKSFRENFVGIESVAINVIDSFLGLQQKLFGDIEISLRNKDLKSLELSSHSLKGVVSNFYAERCRILCYEIEKKAKVGELHGAEELVEELQAEMNRLIPHLLTLKHEMKT